MATFRRPWRAAPSVRACAGVIAWLLAPLDANAQPAEPPQSPDATAPAAPTSTTLPPLPVAPSLPPAPTTPPPGDDDPAWERQYAAARERLLAGSFDEAADMLDRLAAHARDAEHRALAETLRDIARSYHDRGMTLVRRNDLGESNLPARSIDQRTTDEIAVLYLNTLTYGIGTGLWIDAHTLANTDAGVLLPMLLTTGASAGAVALLDVGHMFRYGVPQSTVSGLYLGLEEGLLISLWNLAANPYGAWDGTTVADVIWLTSTAGMVGGAVIGTTVGTTPGRASFVGSAGLWTGAIVGLTALAVSDPSHNNAAGALLAADVGLNLGIVGGMVGASMLSPSVARVRFLDLGGLGGGFLFGGLAAAIDNRNDNGEAVLGLTALGAASGLAVAAWATRNMPADRPEERPSATALQLHPALLPVRGGATVGIQGSL